MEIKINRHVILGCSLFYWNYVIGVPVTGTNENEGLAQANNVNLGTFFANFADDCLVVISVIGFLFHFYCCER